MAFAAERRFDDEGDVHAGRLAGMPGGMRNPDARVVSKQGPFGIDERSIAGLTTEMTIEACCEWRPGMTRRDQEREALLTLEVEAVEHDLALADMHVVLEEGEPHHAGHPTVYVRAVTRD